MDQILLCSSCMPQTTAISNTFIDTYMLHANGSYVKVYLYLAMCIQSGAAGLSISSLADNMENTEKDIIRALLYWEKNGLIAIQRQENNAISGVTLLQIPPSCDTGGKASGDSRMPAFPLQADGENGKNLSTHTAVPASKTASVYGSSTASGTASAYGSSTASGTASAYGSSTASGTASAYGSNSTSGTASTSEAMSSQEAASTLENMPRQGAASTLENMSKQEAASALENMSKQEAASALENMSKQGAASTLENMSRQGAVSSTSEANTDQETASSFDTQSKQKAASISGTLPSGTDPKEEQSTAETAGTQGHRIQVSQEQSSRLAKNEEFVWICRIVENYLERPLNPTEVHLLIYLYDDLHFSEELILYLYEYCCSLQKTNVRYVQTVAFSWADNGVTTPAQAQDMAANYSGTHSAIAKTLALGRPLAGIEKRYVERWEKDWQMDLAVILEACNRTMLTIQKADFKYIEGILNNWHNSHVHTLQDIEACDESYKKQKKKEQASGTKTGSKKSRTTSGKPNQFQTFQQRNTSAEEMDELEKVLLTKS